VLKRDPVWNYYLQPPASQCNIRSGLVGQMERDLETSGDIVILGVPCEEWGLVLDIVRNFFTEIN
jgi:hypothetical protein